MQEGTSQASSLKNCRRAALVASGLIFSLALLNLLAYLRNASALAGIFPDAIPMAPYTAASFILITGGLLLCHKPSGRKRLAARTAAVLVLLLSVSGLSSLLPPSPQNGAIPVWKMSPFTTGLFILSAAILLRLARAKAGADRAFVAAAAVLMALSSLILLGYLYGSPFFYGGTVIPVAFTTGLGFLLLSAALLASDPGSLLATPFFGDSLKAVLFRNFLPLIVAAVLLDDLFDLAGANFPGGAPARNASFALLSMAAAAWLVRRISARIGDQVALAHNKQLESERLLAYSQNMLKSVIDNTLAMVYMLDTGGRFTAVNKALADLLGRPAAEIAGKSRRELMPGATAAQHEENDRLVIADGRPRQYEEIAYSGDKTEHTYLTMKFPLRDDAGGIIGLGGVSTDISAQKRAEAELHKLNTDLSERKQDIENLLYLTTHDLRGPLINIDGYTQNLSADFEKLRQAIAPASLPGDARHTVEKITGGSIPAALDFINKSAASMNQVINTLLKVARLGQVQMNPETLDAGASLKNVLDTLHYQLEEAGCAVIAPDLPPCRADAGALTHIFTNLLANAIKYRDKSRPLTITVGWEKTASTVRYSIADNGLGISAENLPRIWEFFYSGSIPGIKKGEGIGLPMIRRMAEKNSGKVWAESKEGAGSTFFVELPLK